MLNGYIPSDRFLPYLTWTQIRDLPDKENTVIVQPVSSIEQHGAHLPLAVDATLGMGVLGRAFSKLDASIPAYCLPPLCYGKANEHWHFPGTISLSAETLLAVLKEVAASIYRAGFRKLAFINSHGGQPQVLDIAARDLHQNYPDFALFSLFLWRVPIADLETLFSPEERRYGIHAGDLETSAMLAIAPELVCMDKAVREFPPPLSPESHLSLEGNLPFAWTTQDLSTSGVLGDATVATPEKGDRLVSQVVDRWVEVLADIHRFRWPQKTKTQ